MKKGLIISLIWIVIVACWWGLFFYCDGKNDGYVGMGLLTGTVLLCGGIVVSITIAEQK